MNEKIEPILTGSCEPKRANHEMLDDAITEIDSVIYHADELFGRIMNNGTQEDPAKNPPSLVPTLASTLSNAPCMIRDKNAELHEILNKISEALF